MKRVLALAIVIALGAGATQAKTAYCQDPTTHKRISCKTAPATVAPVTVAPTPSGVRRKPYPIAATPVATDPAKPLAATSAAPAKKPSMFSGMMKPKLAPTPTPTPMRSPALISSSTAMATGSAPHCSKGKICGHSCIAVAKVCHKPS